MKHHAVTNPLDNLCERIDEWLLGAEYTLYSGDVFKEILDLHKEGDRFTGTLSYYAACDLDQLGLYGSLDSIEFYLFRVKNMMARLHCEILAAEDEWLSGK